MPVALAMIATVGEYSSKFSFQKRQHVLQMMQKVTVIKKNTTNQITFKLAGQSYFHDKSKK